MSIIPVLQSVEIPNRPSGTTIKAWLGWNSITSGTQPATTIPSRFCCPARFFIWQPCQSYRHFRRLFPRFLQTTRVKHPSWAGTISAIPFSINPGNHVGHIRGWQLLGRRFPGRSEMAVTLANGISRFMQQPLIKRCDHINPPTRTSAHGWCLILRSQLPCRPPSGSSAPAWWDCSD